MIDVDELPEVDDVVVQRILARRNFSSFGRGRRPERLALIRAVQGRLSVAELAGQLGVDARTINRDLVVLSQSGA